MDQKEFLARVLPTGFHYIAYPGDNKDQHGRIIWNHSVFVEPHDGVRLSDRTASRNKDVYFAVAGYKQAKIFDPKLGKEKNYRKQDNVAALKCLFLDLDFKNYQSPEEAVKALGEFLVASQLEKPTIIVRTGGGLHVYWTFPEQLPKDEWQVLANGLAGLAENLGLKADLQCTIDSARILRMPGTRNHKYDHAPLCEIVSKRPDDVDMEALSKRLHGVTSMRARSRAPRPNIKLDPDVAGMFADSEPNDLGAGVGWESFMGLLVGDGGCPMAAAMLARAGAGDAYGIWNNMLLLASHTSDGREYAHLMSSGHEEYTAGEVDRAFDAKLLEHAKGVGPTTCDAFAISGAKECAICPHRGKIRSPIMLGRKKPEPQASPMVMPTYNHDGWMCCRVLARDGSEPVEVRLIDMELVGTPSLNRMPTTGSPILEMTFTSDTGKQKKLYRVVMDTSRIKNREYLMGQFGAQKIGIRRGVEKPLEEVMVAWVNFLRRAGIEAPSAFGWIDMGDRRGFAIAGELYASDGHQHRIGIAPGYERGFGAAGEPGPWQDLAALLIADERAEMQITLATAFAAPLMEFTELSSTAVSVRSTMSGVGKTSALRAARAVYGDPDFMSQASDTPTYVEATLAAQTNMPWYWDEVRRPDHDQLSNTIYQILQGKSKGRGSSDGGAKPTLRTRGMLIMASNLSLHEIMTQAGLGTDAGSYRILEIDIPARVSSASNTPFNKAMGALKSNYGHAGAIYARYLAMNRDQVEKVMHGVSAGVDAEYEALQAERYWLAAVKTILAGAILATKAGICAFDVKRMNESLKKLVVASRVQAREAVNGEDIVGHIWRTFITRAVVTDHFVWNKGPGRPTTVSIWRHQPGQPGQFGTVALRLAAKDNTLSITADIIREYAERNKLHAAIVLDQVRRIPGCQKIRATIDSGMEAGVGSTGGRQVFYMMNASAVLGAEEVKDWVTKKSGAASRPAASPGSSSGTGPSGSSQP